jgi:dCMP deaminase
MKKQKRLDSVFMKIAKEIATLSHCVRTKVGAVIVREGNVISFGYNGMPSGMDNCCEVKSYVTPGTYDWADHIKDLWPEEDEVGRYKLETKREVLHAESNAILKAAKTGISTDGSTLYLTTSPCIDCSKLIIQAGIQRVVYLNEYRDISGLTFLKDFVEVQQFTDEV